MSRYTYSVEANSYGKWFIIMTEQRGYCQGWMAHARESPGPRLAFRLMRGDGRVLEEVSALEEVSIGMVAGFPTAEQFEHAGNEALERARLIREREAARELRRGEPVRLPDPDDMHGACDGFGGSDY